MKQLVLLIFLFLVLTSKAQDRATISNLNENKLSRVEAAKANIVSLKRGVLLVRLDFHRREVAYYKKYNNTNEASKILAKQEKINREIIDAFNTYFTFCQVYYFDMEDSRKLLEGKIDSIVFYNNECVEDPRIKLNNTDWYIGEFGYIEQDTTVYYSGSTPTPHHDANPEGKTYYGGSKNSKPALVLRDQKFIQLRDPFPYYIGFSPFGSVYKRYRLPVKKMQAKLENYFNKNQ